MSEKKKNILDSWIDNRIKNAVKTGANEVSYQFRVYLTAFYLISMLVYASYCVILLNNIGKMSDALMLAFSIVFYSAFFIMAIISIWVILRVKSKEIVKLDKLKNLYLASKILRRVLGIITYIITIVTLLQTWDQGMQARLLSALVMIAFSIGNIIVIVSDIYKKRLKKEKRLKKLAEIEAKKEQLLKNRVKLKTERLTTGIASVFKGKDKNIEQSCDMQIKKDKADTLLIANGIVDGVKEQLTAWEIKFLELLNICYDKGIVGIPKVEESVMVVASNFIDKYDNINRAVDKYAAYQMSKCGTSGFLTGIGGLLTLPIAVPANLASVIYIQLRTISTIASMYGCDPTDEKVRTLAFACLTGNGMADILKSVGIEMNDKNLLSVVDNLPIAVFSSINKKVCLRFATKAGEKGIANIAKFIPLLGGVIGGTVDVVATNIIVKNAKKVFSELQLDKAEEDLIEIKESDIEWIKSKK